MFEIILEMENERDNEKKIVAPEDWGYNSSDVADKLCNILEKAREDDCTFVCINNIIIRVENIWAARVQYKPDSSDSGTINISQGR